MQKDYSSQLGAFVKASHYSTLLFQPQGHAEYDVANLADEVLGGCQFHINPFAKKQKCIISNSWWVVYLFAFFFFLLDLQDQGTGSYFLPLLLLLLLLLLFY